MPIISQMAPPIPQMRDGMPRLRRTEWIESEGTRGTYPPLWAGWSGAGIAGLGWLGQDEGKAGESVGYLEGVILLKATGDYTEPVYRKAEGLSPQLVEAGITDVSWWDAKLIDAFNRWAARKAIGAVSLDPDTEASDPMLPNPDYVVITPGSAFYALIEDALSPANEARLRSALQEAEIDPVEFVGGMRARRPMKPELPAPPRFNLWPALIVGGIGVLGIWALWKGKR